jgi:SAM-dependent methyltransferase
MIKEKIINLLHMRDNQRDRENWIKSKLLELKKGSKILDAGAGELQYKKFCSHLNYVSQDFGKYDGVGDKNGLQTKNWDNSKLDIISDITKIPEKDNSFDAIMCIEVFEHLPEPIKAIKEFSRLLKKGGKLILTAPVCSLTHFSPHYYYNGFSRYFYEKHLQENDFRIKELVFNGNWFDYLHQELNRTDYMIKKYTSLNLISRLFIKLIMFPSSLLLLLCSKKDRGSNEMLSFGINIIAVKVSN